MHVQGCRGGGRREVSPQPAAKGYKLIRFEYFSVLDIIVWQSRFMPQMYYWTVCSHLLMIIPE